MRKLQSFDRDYGKVLTQFPRQAAGAQDQCACGIEVSTMTAVP